LTVAEEPIILVVDDDRTIRLLVARILSADGFSPSMVATVAEAKQAVRDLQPQAVILDLGLPDGDGLALGRWIRSRFPAVGLLMLTGRSSVEDRVIGLNEGADDYLVKPFVPAELTARLRSIMRRAHEPAAAADRTLAFEAGFLDRVSQVFSVAGTDVALTAAECAILEALAERPDHVATRAHLLERMGAAEDADPRNVDYHVFNLRAKLKAVGIRVDAIRVVRGVGYRYHRAGG
jgi:DNA-binding response OmpR family regulator